MIFNHSFIYNQFERLNVYENVSKEEALPAAGQMLDYLTFQEDNLSDFFNEKEKEHLKDVRGLVIALHIIILLIFCFIIASAFILFKSKRF